MRFTRSKFILAFSLSFAATAAYCGGNKVGNGGRAVVCRSKDQTVHVELLDLYEGRILRGVSLDSKITGSDPYEIAESRLTALGKADPKSEKILTSLFQKLKEDIRFEDDIKIQPIDDSEHPFVPSDPDCQVQQMVILRKNPLPGEKRVLADNSLWKQMAPVQQAALLLHETIYEHLAFLGEHDSIKARYLVSYLMSSSGDPVDSKSYWDLIKKLRLPIYH
jgi:hypothetical protein